MKKHAHASTHTDSQLDSAHVSTASLRVRTGLRAGSSPQPLPPPAIFLQKIYVGVRGP